VLNDIRGTRRAWRARATHLPEKTETLDRWAAHLLMVVEGKPTRAA
jgi:hypothetical protein